jgi:hypothetical protein
MEENTTINEEMMTIITYKNGLRQVSSFSDGKIKHITETNQWGYVIDAILKSPSEPPTPKKN